MKKEVRQAISHAINKERIMENLYGELAAVAKCIVPPELISSDGLMEFEYSPGKAQEILREANIDLSKPINVMLRGENPEILSLIGEDLRP